MGGEDADRIGADADEGGMAERDQRAVADQQIEPERGDGEDHHPREQVEQIGFRAERRGQRHQREAEEDRERQHFRDAARASPASGRRSSQRPLAGNRPVGRKYSTSAISR